MELLLSCLLQKPNTCWRCTCQGKQLHQRLPDPPPPKNPNRKVQNTQTGQEGCTLLTSRVSLLCNSMHYTLSLNPPAAPHQLPEAPVWGDPPFQSPLLCSAALRLATMATCTGETPAREASSVHVCLLKASISISLAEHPFRKAGTFHMGVSLHVRGKAGWRSCFQPWLETFSMKPEAVYFIFPLKVVTEGKDKVEKALKSNLLSLFGHVSSPGQMG